MAAVEAKAPWRDALSGVVAAVLVTWAFAPAIAKEPPLPSTVTARYRLTFNGLDVGTYDFVSQFSGKTYTATGQAKISALFGAFKWNGIFKASGSLEGRSPHPAAYDMTYAAKKKVVSVKMAFDADRVSSIELTPNKPPHPDAIKVRPQDLQSVLDPIAATLAISNTNTAEACNRAIPIFDGKVRYDLRLSLKGREAIEEDRPTGQPRELVICRVKYVPIAGHKPSDFVNPWIDYDRIEIAIRPIPSAGIFVPYRITVPSTIGPAVMNADTINITSADNVQIALKQ